MAEFTLSFPLSQLCDCNIQLLAHCVTETNKQTNRAVELWSFSPESRWNILLLFGFRLVLS